MVLCYCSLWKLIIAPQKQSGNDQAVNEVHYPADPDNAGLKLVNLIIGTRELSSYSDKLNQAGADPQAGQEAARTIWVIQQKMPLGSGKPRVLWFKRTLP